MRKINKPTVETIMDSLNLNKDLQFVKDNLLYLVVAGSKAYGTDRPESDTDVRGICIKPLEMYLSTKEFEQREDKTNDITIYEITKFIRLAKNLNPNVVELLFVPDDCIIYAHPAMNYLLKHKHLFLSKKAQHSFLGYAHSQLGRIERHKRWLDHPLTLPKRKDYDLDPKPIFSYEKLTSLGALSNEDLDVLGIDTDIKTYVTMELRFKKDYEEWRKYDTWVRNRNPERAKLEAKMGFDGKHASHLIRLQSVSEELATTGTMHTRRPDADFLKAIRNGDFTYEEVLAISNERNTRVIEAFTKSDLPYSVDHVKIDELLLTILLHWFKIHLDDTKKPW